MKTKIHNEWFMPIKTPTCLCGQKKTQVFAWGQYVRAKWNVVDYFCKDCFQERVVERLIAHAKPCGCKFVVNARSGYSIPDWIQMPELKECRA